jgi:hypothetical protein
MIGRSHPSAKGVASDGGAHLFNTLLQSVPVIVGILSNVGRSGRI